MTYIPQDRFIQICAASFPPDHYTEIIALDESGGVWRFNTEHEVWVPMSHDRATVTPRSLTATEAIARAVGQERK